MCKIVIQNNKTASDVIKGHIAEGKALSWEQNSSFRLYLLAKLGKKAEDAEDLADLKDDVVAAVNVCKAKYNWPEGDYTLSDSECISILESARKDYRCNCKVSTGNVERTSRAIKVASGFEEDKGGLLFAKENFAKLDLAKYLEYVVTEGDPEERYITYKCLQYIGMTCCELLLLLPNNVFDWFIEPYGLAVYKSNAKMPRLVCAFQRALLCVPEIEDWYNECSKNELIGAVPAFVDLFDSHKEDVPVAELFTGLDFQSAARWVKLKDQKPQNECIGKEYERWQSMTTEAHKWLEANKDNDERATAAYMLAPEGGYAPEPFAEGLAAYISKPNNDDTLAFVKDIPLASIRNCETGEELYELLSRFKGGV